LYGYNGKVLIVDLTEKTFETQELNPDWAYHFIGGATLGARYLYELMPAKTHVFAPESVVGFVCGPLNGTKALLGARFTVVSKSPATNGWNDSNCGGSFAPALRKTGYDAVFVKGISETPVYIFIDDGKPEIRDAAEIWGKTTTVAEGILRAELGDKISVAQIGPGGENKSYMAAVVNDTHRVAGRGGSGAVMGSKKLRAIVCRGGSAEIKIKDDAALVACNKECIEYGLPGNKGAGPVAQFKTLGTSANYNSCVMMADAPIKNWIGVPEIDITEEQADALNGHITDPKYRVEGIGCSNCYIKCGAYYKLDHEKYKLDHATRPEYESLGALGSTILNGDSATAIIVNWLCNQYGYDTISLGATIAWTMECYDKGILTLDELDGIDLKWGDPNAIVAITERICANEGIGVHLNLASQGAARSLGKGEECLVVAHGIELPYHGSIYNPGLARIFQYDPTPGRHVKGGRGVPFGHNPPEVKYNYENTGEADAAGLLEWELTDSSGICGFGNFLLSPWIAIRMINAITGYDYSQEQMNQFAYRSFTMRHAFNLREGYRRPDFTISDRAVGKPPLHAGPLKGITVDNEKLADNFFGFLGWDLETTVPPKNFLEDLGGLECVIGDLYPK
jgi:aldehyde:ferredoxin oxidoreductase